MDGIGNNKCGGGIGRRIRQYKTNQRSCNKADKWVAVTPVGTESDHIHVRCKSLPILTEAVAEKVNAKGKTDERGEQLFG